MKHTPVNSSRIVSVAHDPDTNTLHIKFRGGSTYAYDGVPADVHDEMVAADSAGSYFHANIKNAYPTRQV